MKTLIKSSFFFILLMAIFNIGVSNAYAEEAIAVEKTLTATDTIISKCYELTDIYATFGECERRVSYVQGYVIVIFEDCVIVVVSPEGDITTIDEN